jgi:hypothetical protein
MRAELADAMTGLIAGADPENIHAALRDDEIQELIRLAMFAARARTVVERDGYTNELLVLPQPATRGTGAAGQSDAAHVRRAQRTRR